MILTPENLRSTPSRLAGSSPAPPTVGIVVIGRNEGERLIRCLESVRDFRCQLIYVDSGSSDGSPDTAIRLGVDVLALDSSLPFSAARARNEGFAQLQQKDAPCELVMFVDGDCEVRAGWLERARDAFASDPRLAAAAGRLRERFPDASVYNRLCEMEWDVPPGEAAACGGIAMFRAAAFEQAGRFNSGLIAGEEPELCVRLRRLGWKIARLDAEMASHDAAMTRFSQWWKRAVRAGHAYAEGAALHGRSPARHFVREARSAWFFGLILPVVTLTALFSIGSWGLLTLAVYPLLWLKTALARRRSHGDPWRLALLYSTACVIAKPAECLGQIRYWSARLRGRRSKLLEHKAAGHQRSRHAVEGERPA